MVTNNSDFNYDLSIDGDCTASVKKGRVLLKEIPVGEHTILDQNDYGDTIEKTGVFHADKTVEIVLDKRATTFEVFNNTPITLFDIGVFNYNSGLKDFNEMT